MAKPSMAALVVLLLCVTSLVSAVTYYVDQTATSSSPAGTAGDPCLDFSVATTKLNRGATGDDTVYFVAVTTLGGINGAYDVGSDTIPSALNGHTGELTLSTDPNSLAQGERAVITHSIHDTQWGKATAIFNHQADSSGGMIINLEDLTFKIMGYYNTDAYSSVFSFTASTTGDIRDTVLIKNCHFNFTSASNIGSFNYFFNGSFEDMTVRNVTLQDFHLHETGPGVRNGKFMNVAASETFTAENVTATGGMSGNANFFYVTSKHLEVHGISLDATGAASEDTNLNHAVYGVVSGTANITDVDLDNVTCGNACVNLSMQGSVNATISNINVNVAGSPTGNSNILTVTGDSVGSSTLTVRNVHANYPTSFNWPRMFLTITPDSADVTVTTCSVVATHRNHSNLIYVDSGKTDSVELTDIDISFHDTANTPYSSIAVEVGPSISVPVIFSGIRISNFNGNYMFHIRNSESRLNNVEIDGGSFDYAVYSSSVDLTEIDGLVVSGNASASESFIHATASTTVVTVEGLQFTNSTFTSNGGIFSALASANITTVDPITITSDHLAINEILFTADDMAHIYAEVEITNIDCSTVLPLSADITEINSIDGSATGDVIVLDSRDCGGDGDGGGDNSEQDDSSTSPAPVGSSPLAALLVAVVAASFFC